MPSSKEIKKHPIIPDPVFGDETVAKFINYILRKGKKTVARKNVYKAFDAIKEKTKQDPVEVFKKAIENVTPSLEVRPKRVGGATYQVPTEVTGKRGLALSLRWIIQGAKAKKGRSLADNLAQEIMDAAKNEGTAIRKKENMHRMAEANRAFAHFAW
jgi:small subunit ribosomal protein S7